MRSVAANCPKLCPIIVTLLLSLNACGSADDRLLEEKTDHVYPVEPDAKITIQNRDGAVIVYGSNVNELRVQAVKKAYNWDRLNQIEIEVSGPPSNVSIAAKFPPQSTWALSDRSGTVDFTITIPTRASISGLDLHAGEIRLEAVHGRELRAWLGDGRIFVRNCFTNLDLTMNRGTLTLSYDWWEKEKFAAQARVNQGNAWLWVPGDAAFRLVSEVNHGRIANDFSNLSMFNNPGVPVTKIDQIVNGGGVATIEIRVDDGKIRIGEANP